MLSGHRAILAVVIQLSTAILPLYPAYSKEGDATGVAGDPALKEPVTGPTGDIGSVGLVPWPMKGEISKERVKMGGATRIVFSSPALEPLAKVLAGQIALLGGRALPVVAGAPQAGDICLRVNPKLVLSSDPYAKLDPKVKGLEQKIIASAKGVLIEGVDAKATAMASMMFLQSLEGSGPTLRFPRMTLEDKPGSQYTGTMVDLGRQWHPVEHLLQLVDLCQLYKVGFLHLHFTDDQGYRLPSKSYPQIPTKNASYTEDEIRKLVAYADVRGVTIVPEIELPGHSSALQTGLPQIMGAKNPTTGGYDTLGVINIANPEIYPVLETIIAEACDLFKSSPYFHIGADETNFGAFFQHPAVKEQLKVLNAKGITNEQVFGDFLNRVNAMVKKHGKRTICWEGFGSEMKVDKDIIMMAWHGSSHAPQDLLKAGFDLINVPWTPSIYSSARESYEWNKWSLNLSESPGHSRQFEMNPQVIGGQMVLWEKGPDDMIPMLRGKMPPRQERVHSPLAGRSFDDFESRFSNTDEMLEKLLYPVKVKLGGLTNSVENLFREKPVEVTLECPVEGAKILYTFGKEDPTLENGKVYQKPFTVSNEQAGEVYIAGYYGPRVELRVRAFGPDGQPLGGTKWVELRCEAPRLKYSLYEGPVGTLLKEMPDLSRMKPVEEGRLARLESTNRLSRKGVAPLVLQATGKIDIRAAGAYEISLKTKNGESAKNTTLKIGGKVIGPFVDGDLKADLSTGIQPFAIEQFANDGNVGVTLTFQKYLQDSGPEPRHFNNEYIHQWMLPLAN